MGCVDTLLLVRIHIIYVVIKAIENYLDRESNSKESIDLTDFTAHYDVIMTRLSRPKMRKSAFVLES